MKKLPSRYNETQLRAWRSEIREELLSVLPASSVQLAERFGNDLAILSYLTTGGLPVRRVGEYDGMGPSIHDVYEVDHRPVDLINPGRRSDIAAARCTSKPFGCGTPITEFRDELSEKEFAISGLCQTCQDRVFAEVPE